MANLILPLRIIGDGPHHHEYLDDRTKRRELRHEKDAGTGLPLLQPPPEMLKHCSPVVSDQDAALAGSNFKHIGVREPFEPAVPGGSEIDCWFASPDCQNDAVMDVGVGLEADHDRDSPILARARCSVSQSAGFSSDNGMLLASNSRSLSSRYLSISGLWSR